MLVPAREVRLIVIGPGGAPKTLVASLVDGRILASFTVDKDGPWLVQVLATVASGSRPVLDAMVFAGVSPPVSFVSTLAPGEEAAKGAKDDDDAMVRIIDVARASEHRSLLTRDAALDRLARAHTEAMQKARIVGHDIGGGDVQTRLAAAGIHDRVSGENCANASSTEGAHRALWASPSHRSNLLLDQFTRVGVSVIKALTGLSGSPRCSGAEPSAANAHVAIDGRRPRGFTRFRVSSPHRPRSAVPGSIVPGDRRRLRRGLRRGGGGGALARARTLAPLRAVAYADVAATSWCSRSAPRADNSSVYDPVLERRAHGDRALRSRARPGAAGAVSAPARWSSRW